MRETWLFGASEECHILINLRKGFPHSHNTRTATRKIGLFSARIDGVLRNGWRMLNANRCSGGGYERCCQGLDAASQACGVRDREVVGSNPIAPTFKSNGLRASKGARFAFAVTFAATLGLEEHRVLLVNFLTRLPTSKVARYCEILSILRRSIQ